MQTRTTTTTTAVIEVEEVTAIRITYHSKGPEKDYLSITNMKL